MNRVENVGCKASRRGYSRSYRLELTRPGTLWTAIFTSIASRAKNKISVARVVQRLSSPATNPLAPSTALIHWNWFCFGIFDMSIFVLFLFLLLLSFLIWIKWSEIVQNHPYCLNHHFFVVTNCHKLSLSVGSQLRLSTERYNHQNYLIFARRNSKMVFKRIFG